jgi:hypothetical protein
LFASWLYPQYDRHVTSTPIMDEKKKKKKKQLERRGSPATSMAVGRFNRFTTASNATPVLPARVRVSGFTEDLTISNATLHLNNACLSPQIYVSTTVFLLPTLIHAIPVEPLVDSPT